MRNLPKLHSVALLLFFLSQSFSFVFPLMSLLLLKRGTISDSQVLLIVSAAYFISGIFQPYFGKKLDSGGKKIIFLALVFNLCGVWGFLQNSENLYAVIATLGFFLIGISILMMAGATIVDGFAPENKKTKAYSTYYGLSNLGLGLSALIANRFLEQFESTLLILDAVTTSLFGILCLIYFGQKKPPNLSNTKQVQSSVSSKSRRAWVSVQVLLFYIVMLSHVGVFPILYKKLGLDPASLMTEMFATNNFIVAIVSFFLASKLSKISYSQRTVIGGVALAVGHSVLPFIPPNFYHILVTATWSAGEAILYPITAHLIYRACGPENAGYAAGLKSFLLRGGFVIAPLLGLIVAKNDKLIFSLIFGILPLIATIFSRTYFKEQHL